MSDFQHLVNFWQKSLPIRNGTYRKPGDLTDMHPLIIEQLNYMKITKELSFEAAEFLIGNYLKGHDAVDRIGNDVNPESDYAECALKFAGYHKQNSDGWKSGLSLDACLKDIETHTAINPVTILDETCIDLLAKHLPATFTGTTENLRKVTAPTNLKQSCSSKMIATPQNLKRTLISAQCESSPKKTNLKDDSTALRQKLYSEMSMNTQNIIFEYNDFKEQEQEIAKYSGNAITFKTAKQQYMKDQQKRIGQPNRRSLFLTRSRPTHQFNKPSKLEANASETKDDSKIFSDDKMKNIDPKMVELMMSEIMDNGPPIKWDDIAGLEFAKATIKEIVIWPMLRPDLFTGLRSPPKGVLLFGPPGTGKTLIGKCIASQTKSTFFSISASSLTSKWIGEGEKLVKALFTVARCHQPAVIFIDEIDSLLTQRSESEHESSRRLKTEFLVQLDGATTSSSERLLVVGATNRPQELDEALRRRLVKRLYIPLPESEGRGQIVRTLLKNQPHILSDSDIGIICNNTDGYSGSDMANLCKEAALGPIRRLNFADIEHINENDVEPIVLKDFIDSLKQVRASVSQKDLQCYIEWNEKYGSNAVPTV